MSNLTFLLGVLVVGCGGMGCGDTVTETLADMSSHKFELGVFIVGGGEGNPD